MKTKLYLITTMILIGIYFITLWTLDISVAAIGLQGKGVMIGLWGEVTDPWLKYHQALYLNIITLFVMIISLVLYSKSLEVR